VHALLRGEPGDDILGIGPARHDARADERRGLDVVQPGFGERLDQLDLVSGADRAGFDLKAFARTFLMDVHMLWQVGHVWISLRKMARRTLSPTAGRRTARQRLIA